MASGTIALTRTGSGYLTGQIVWSSASNGTAANTSNVTAQLQIQRSALNTTTGTFKGTFTVGSTSETVSWYGSLPSMEWVTIKTITVTVNHNADGSGNCYLYAIVNGPTQTTMEGTYVSGSSTVTLDTIPRHASLISVTDFTDEGNPVITYSNPAGTAVSLLQACLSLDGVHSDISYRDIPKTGTRYTFSLTEAERNTLRSAAANSKAITVHVFLWCKLADSEVLRNTTVTMRIVNANPILSPVVTDTNSTTCNVTGNASILVAGHSTASVAINAQAKKYATITRKIVEHGTATLSGDGSLSVTNNPIKITVTDSRGNETTQYADNTIVPYINPTCAIGNNTPSAEGAFTLVATGLFYNGAIGKTTNTLAVEYRYKSAGGSYGSWIDFGTVTKNGNGYTATANLSGLDYQTVYTFQARVMDSVTAVASAEKQVIAEPVFDWNQTDFQFNVPVTMRRNGLGMYGEDMFFSEDADACQLTGWYYITPDTAKGINAQAVMRVEAVNQNHITQTAYSGAYTTTGMTILQRTKHYGVWSSWKWITPLMKLNREYLTTEWYDGEPVYCKTIDFLALPNSTTLNVAHGISGKKRNIRYTITSRSTNGMLSAHPNITAVIPNDTAVYITTNADMSGVNAYFTLWYTKY